MKELILFLGTFFSPFTGEIPSNYTQHLQAFSLQNFWNELWEEDDIWTIQKRRLRPEMRKDFENLHREWTDDYHRLIDGEFILDEEKGISGYYEMEVPEQVGTYIWEENPKSPEKYSFREGFSVLSGKHSDLYARYLESNVELWKEINEEMKKSLRFACQICQQKQRVDILCDMCF
jgi:hypothetical protein